MENNNRQYTLGTLFIVLVLGILIGWVFASYNAGVGLFRNGTKQGNNIAEKVQSMTELIESEYVDEYSQDSISEIVMTSITTALDPHCQYFSAAERAKQDAEIRGNFSGIGAILHQLGDSVAIANTLPGSPAQKAGLQTGDIIITVDADTVSGVKMDMDDAISRIRGPQGKNVDLGIQHYGAKEIQHYSVGRDVIPINSLVYSGMVTSNTGYIRLNRFAGTTFNEFHDALTDLKTKGMKNLILDLRDNGGGVLECAVRICNEFLKKGDLIVYTKGAHSMRDETKADGKGIFQDGKVVVMVDEFSASASEVVSGALQDNDRATIVGRRTFGKGLVQQQFDFTDGSAVWLTVARYYTPSGRCIQRPYDKGTDEYYNEFLDQLVKNSKSDSAITKLTDTTRYFTTSGRTVYGGGGIYPDHVLPYYRDSLLSYYNLLSNRRVLDDYAYKTVAANYADLIRQYPTDKDFINEYTVSTATQNGIVEAGRKAGIPLNKAGLNKYHRNIFLLYKAYMASYLYGNESFFKIHVTIDTEIQKTIHDLKLN